jgi:hypothetical protein
MVRIRTPQNVVSGFVLMLLFYPGLQISVVLEYYYSSGYEMYGLMCIHDL